MNPDELASVHLSYGRLLEFIADMNFGSDTQDEATRTALAQAFLAGRNYGEATKATRPPDTKARSPFRNGLAPQRTS